MPGNNEMDAQNSTPLLSPDDTKEDVTVDVDIDVAVDADVTDQQQQQLKLFFTRENISKVLEEMKQLYMIAFPMILTGVLSYGKSATSMLFMGMMGKSALAGGSLAISIGNITGYSVLSGLATGMEGISSQAFGARQWSLIGLTLNRTVLILLLTCFPISLIWLNSHIFFPFWCQNPAVAAAATTYLTYSIPSLLFLSFTYPLKIYLRTQEITKPLTISAVVSLMAQTSINYYLICHRKLGVQAAALASAFADLNTLLALASYLGFSGVCKRSWPGWSLECFREWKPILCQAIPSCLSVCLEWWWYELMIILSGILYNPDEAVACMGILIQATSLVYQFPNALSQAASTRVGNELGANQPYKAKMASFVALWTAIVTGTGAMSFMVGVKDVWGRLFTTDKEIIALVTSALPVVGLCELGNCPQTTACGVVRGSARSALPACLNLVTFYGVGLPVAMLAGFKLGMGLVGLWYGLFAAQITCFAGMVVVLVTTDWIKQAERAKELTGGSMTNVRNEENNNNIDNNIDDNNTEEQISITR